MSGNQGEARGRKGHEWTGEATNRTVAGAQKGAAQPTTIRQRRPGTRPAHRSSVLAGGASRRTRCRRRRRGWRSGCGPARRTHGPRPRPVETGKARGDGGAMGPAEEGTCQRTPFRSAQAQGTHRRRVTGHIQDSTSGATPVARTPRSGDRGSDRGLDGRLDSTSGATPTARTPRSLRKRALGGGQNHHENSG